MAKQKKRSKKVSVKPIGKVIKKTITALKAARSSASAKGKKSIDGHVKFLNATYGRLVRDCKELFDIPPGSNA